MIEIFQVPFLTAERRDWACNHGLFLSVNVGVKFLFTIG